MKEGEYSFAADVMKTLSFNHMCTGALIDPQTVLLPASCIDRRIVSKKDEFPHVRVGNNLLAAADEDTQEVIRTCATIVHSEYAWKGPGYVDNIALLKLEKPAAQPPVSVDGTPCKVNVDIGWYKPGVVEHTMGAPPRLHRINGTRLASEAECKKGLGMGKIPERTFCGTYQPRAICHWDLGSLCVSSCSDDGKQYVTGIASFTNVKNCQAAPYAYTYLDKYIAWILREGAGSSVIRNNSMCQEHDKL